MSSSGFQRQPPPNALHCKPSPLEFWHLLASDWQRITGAATAAGLAAVAVFSVLPAVFTSTAVLSLSNTDDPSPTAELGESKMEANASELVPTSPRFYRSLLRSRRILGALATSELQTSFTETDSSKTRTVAEHLGLGGHRNRSVRRKVVEALRDRQTVVAVEATDVVRLSYTTRSPKLSHDLVVHTLDIVKEFNASVRETYAQRWVEFVSQQMEQQQERLRAARDSLSSFLRANRGNRLPPELRFQRDRLERRVRLRQQLEASLSQSHEAAQSALAKAQPEITLVETPTVPVEPDSRRLALRGGVGFIVGALLGVFLSIVRASHRLALRHPGQDLTEWTRVLSDLRGEIKGLISSLGRWARDPLV